MTYEKPAVVDYGSLLDVTAMVSGGGGEDGGSKLTTPFHHSDVFGQHPPGP